MLGKLPVAQELSNDALVLRADNTVKDVKGRLKVNTEPAHDFVILNNEGSCMGIINRSKVLNGKVMASKINN